MVEVFSPGHDLVVVPAIEAHNLSVRRVRMEIRVRKELSDGPHRRAAVGRHGDQDVRMLIEEHLPASSAGWDQAASAVAGGRYREQLCRPGCGCHAEGDQLRAWPAGEVIDVHSFVDAPIDIHDGRSNRVIVIIAQPSREGFRGVDDLLLVLDRFHSGRAYQA